MISVSKAYHIFCDGSCNNRLPEMQRQGGWAFVSFYVRDNKPHLVAFNVGHIDSTDIPVTSQRMEMMAVINSLAYLTVQMNTLPPRKGWHLRIYSDSAYVVDSIVKGRMQRWKELDDFYNKPNADLWKKIYNLDHKLRVNYLHIRGHIGIPGNELVDKMAKFGGSHSQPMSYPQIQDMVENYKREYDV